MLPIPSLSQAPRERKRAPPRKQSRGGGASFVSRPSLPSAPSSSRDYARVFARNETSAAAAEEGGGWGWGGGEGAGREVNSCLTSSQSEAGLWLTKTAGPGRAPPPHSSFEALVEMCRLLRLHSAAGCRWSRLFFLITNLRLFVDLHPLDLPQSTWSCSLSPVWLVFSVPLLKLVHSD